jgi:minichromosome maintenance protein 10
MLVISAFSQVSLISLLALLCLVVEEDDLSLLTSLLEENESALACSVEENNSLPQEDGEPDVYDELFDADGDGESYTEEAEEEVGKTEQKENLATLFGDVGDLTDEEVPTLQPTENRVLTAPAQKQEKTNQELQGALTTCLLSFLRDKVDENPSLHQISC